MPEAGRPTHQPGPATEDAAGRWKTTALLAICLVLTMATWFSASAVVPQLREEWSLSATTGSLLTIAVQIGFVVGAVTSAALSLPDVHPPRTVLIWGAIGAAGANALILLAGDVALALPLRFATGFFLAGVYPPALKLIATWFRRGRGLALGLMVGALTVGSALPHLINGLGGLDWRTVIAATSATTLLGAGLVALLVSEGPFAFRRAAFDPSRVGDVLRNRGLRLASLGYFGHMWELYAMWAWFVVFYGAHLNSAGGDRFDGDAAFATFTVIAIGALGCWLGGVAGDRYGRAEATAVMMAVSGICTLMVGLLFGGPTWLVLAVALVWGVAVVGDSAQFSTMVTELADQDYVGTALTLQLAIGFTLTVVTIFLIPVLERAVTWRWAFAFLAPGPAAGIVAMLKLRSLLASSTDGGRQGLQTPHGS